jgi:Immunity protein 26
VSQKLKTGGIKATEGDVFQIFIDADRVGHGQIVGSRRHTLLIAVFKEVHPRSSAPVPAQIVSGEVAFLAEALDAKLWNGDWPIVGNVAPDHVRIPFPSYKITIDRATNWYVESFDTLRKRPAKPWEVDALPLREIVSPIRLEKALQALHGIGQWDSSYRLFEFDVMQRSSTIRP